MNYYVYQSEGVGVPRAAYTIPGRGGLFVVSVVSVVVVVAPPGGSPRWGARPTLGPVGPMGPMGPILIDFI